MQNDLIHESLRYARHRFAGTTHFGVNRARTGLPPLVADRSQLQQVFLNLIMNAIEAMASHPPIVRRSLRIASGLNPESTEMLIYHRRHGIRHQQARSGSYLRGHFSRQSPPGPE